MGIARTGQPTLKAYAGFIGRRGASFDALHASGIHFKSVVAQDVDVCLMMAGQEDGLAASFLLKKKRSRLHRAVVIQAVKRFVRQKNRGIFHDNAIEGGMRLPASSPSRCVRLAFSKVWDMLFISCVNDADEKQIKRSKAGFMSTKEHPEVHGFGQRA